MRRTTTIAVAIALVLAGTGIGMASATSDVTEPEAAQVCAVPTYVLPTNGIALDRVVPPAACDRGVLNVGQDEEVRVNVEFIDAIGPHDGLDWSVTQVGGSTVCSTSISLANPTATCPLSDPGIYFVDALNPFLDGIQMYEISAVAS